MAKKNKKHLKKSKKQRQAERYQPQDAQGESELRFSPMAWAKLLYMRDAGDTEVGGFGITRADDILYVEDFVLIKQKATAVTVSFDDDDVSDYMMDMVERQLAPEQFMRIWIHTHPEMSASPSRTDEDTFSRVFARCDWAAMIIVSKTEDTYCRVRINSGPLPGEFTIPITVDYSAHEFTGSDHEAWAEEYLECVTKEAFSMGQYSHYDNDMVSRYYKKIGVDVVRHNEPVSAKKKVAGFQDSGLAGEDWGFEVEELLTKDLVELMTPAELSVFGNLDAHDKAYYIDNLIEEYGMVD